MNTSNFFKRNALAIFSLAIAISYGSYSYAKSLVTTNWYLIATQGASPGADVVGAITMDPTLGETCTPPANPIRCAIQFDNPNNFNLTGQTVAAAQALPGVDEQARTNRLP